MEILTSSATSKLMLDFRSLGVVDITGYLSNEFVGSLQSEVIRVFEGNNKRKDFLQPITGNSPRHMHTVSEKIISQESPLIRNFYFNSPEVINFISEINREEVFLLQPYQHPCTINGLTKSNDTHGWHCDSHTFAMVLVAEAPEQQYGGWLEFILGVSEEEYKGCDIEQFIKGRKISTQYFPSGTVYLMSGGSVLHRVSPIIGDHRRISLTCGFTSKEDLTKEVDRISDVDLYT